MKKHMYVISFAVLFAVFVISIFVQMPVGVNSFFGADETYKETFERQILEPDKININTAVAAQLDVLSGIGEARAQAIIQYREENGPFESTSEIIEVDGVSEKMYEEFKHLITV